MIPLSMHEAIPGHHLQASFIIKNKEFPEFRKFMEDRK